MAGFTSARIKCTKTNGPICSIQIVEMYWVQVPLVMRTAGDEEPRQILLATCLSQDVLEEAECHLIGIMTKAVLVSLVIKREFRKGTLINHKRI